MSATLDLAGGTVTLLADSTNAYYKITNSVAGGHLVLSAGSIIEFDDSSGAGFDPAALSFDITINGNSGAPCTIESASANPYFKWALPSTSIAVTATRCNFINSTGAVGSSWVLNYCTFSQGEYCSPGDIASQLRLKDPTTGLRLSFSDTTDPTSSEVRGWINEAMDFIDSQTNHAWRELTVTDEYHSFYGLYDGLSDGLYGRKILIPLNHRMLKTVDHAKGDKIEVWTPDGYEDLLDPANGYTIGPNNDFDVDLTNGQLIFFGNKPYVTDHAIRVTYRFGEATVPYDIRECCIKKVAIRYLESEIYTATVPNGPSLSPSKDSIIDRWQEDIDRILSRRKEYPMINY